MSDLRVTRLKGRTVGSSPSLPDGVVVSGIGTFSDTTQSTSATTGSVIISGGVGIAKSLHVGGNVSVGGTLTYEDVTNIDSVGVVTARNGVKTNVSPSITIRDGSTEKGYIGFNVNDPFIGRKDGVGLSFQNNKIRPVDGDDGSASNNTVDLGEPTYKFKDGYFEGNLYGNGSNLSGIEAAPTVQLLVNGTIGAHAATLVLPNGKATAIVGQTEAKGAVANYESSAYTIPIRVVYNPDKLNSVIFYLKGTQGSTTNFQMFCRSVTTSGTTITYGTQRLIPTNAGGNNIGGDGADLIMDVTYDTTNNKFLLAYRNVNNRLTFAHGVANTAGDDFTFTEGQQNMDGNAQSPKHIKFLFNADNSRALCVWQRSYDDQMYKCVVEWTSGAGDGLNITSAPLDCVTTACNEYQIGYDTNVNRYMVGYNRTGSAYVFVATLDNTGGNVVLNSRETGPSTGNFVIFVPTENKTVMIYETNAQSNSITSVVGTQVSNGTFSWGQEQRIDTSGNASLITATLDSYQNKVVTSWYMNSVRYCMVGTITSNINIMDWTTKFAMDGGAGQAAIGFDPNRKQCILATRDGVSADEGDAQVFQPESTNLTVGNWIGFSKAAYTDGQTGTINVVGNVTTKSGLTPGQKYYLQSDGTLNTTASTPSVVAGRALSATSLLIQPA